MVISNQKTKKLSAPNHNWTDPGQPLDAPDYKHPILSCHINRIDSSHKKFNYPTQPKGAADSRVAHPCGFCKGGSFCCLEVLKLTRAC